MVWIFLVLGIVLLVVGVLLAVLPTLRADRVPAHAEGSEEAWAVLSQPVAVTDELIRLPKDERVLGRLLGSRFLQGSIVGAGGSLVVAGIVLSYALVMPGGLSTAEAAQPPAKPAPTVPQTPAPSQTTAPQDQTEPAKDQTAGTKGETTTPKPSGELDFEIQEGDVSQVVAYNLKLKGLIDNQTNFVDRLIERKLEMKIQIGTFKIPAGADLDKVINIITRQE